jgi:copper transport outer membrane protein MctB
VINFRFHLVSLVAVFLALAVGVVMGYGVLGQPTVRTLQSRIDRVEANANARARENDQLHSQVDDLDAAIAAFGPFAVTDRLPDVPVLVVAVRGVDADTLTTTVQLARRAGAAAPGIIWLESKWALSAHADSVALAKVLGVAVSKRATLRQSGWRALVTRLAQGSTTGTDLLRVLSDSGFVTYQGIGTAGNRDLSTLGGPATRVLLAVGTQGSLAASQVLLPFARAAVAVALPMAAVEDYHQVDNGPDRGSLVALVRSDATLSKRISTIDDLDHPSGAVAAILTLADLGRGVVGHYGFVDGDAGPAPAWSQP